jgi:glyoxylase-like metal-dependent hydrolase (beta-lactamase superfamily II)
VQLEVELEDGVLVTDAPAHRSKAILEWVAETIGKPVKYIAPSHHHHDHAYGVGYFLAAGATLVVPEAFCQFLPQSQRRQLLYDHIQ